jgi:hypothetical protein
MAFNFGSLAKTKPSTSSSYLKPYEIHQNVAIKGTEIKEGTSANGNPWKSLVITFGNDNGIYNHSIFWITSDKDFERTTTDMANGGKRELPSQWERTRDTMAAIGFAFAPTAFEKLQQVSSKAKSFDDIALTFKKILDSVVDKVTTNMKLVGRNSDGRVYATLPNCTGIAQAHSEEVAARNEVEVGEWYTWMVSPFSDDLTKLAFTAYEEKQANSLKNAKPTPVSTSKAETDAVNNFDAPASNTEDVNFDDLLATL